jgi:hypothetical protein
MKKQSEVYDDILTMPLPELKRRVAEALLLFTKIYELLPGMIELTDDAKRHSVGHYRIDEAESLACLLDVAKKKPAIFEPLADKDGGTDPTRFEPELLGERLERAIILGPLVKAAMDFAAPASDTRLHLGNLTRPVLLAMYELVKPQAKHDVTIANLAKMALDFYAALGRLSAATRKANKG